MAGAPHDSSPAALIFGCGYVGLELARTLTAAGWQVAGTARSRASRADVAAAGALHYGSTSGVPSAFVTEHKARSLARYFRKFARGPFERLIVEAAVPFIGLALKLRA